MTYEEVEMVECFPLYCGGDQLSYELYWVECFPNIYTDDETRFRF
jgi:hypothetical protein